MGVPAVTEPASVPTPAAPAAPSPAPTPSSAAPAPAAAEKPQNIKERIASARAMGGSVPLLDAADADRQPRVPGGVPNGGQFATPQQVAALEAAQAAGDQVPEVVETPDAADPPVTSEGEAEGATADGTPAEPQEVVVKLPGRRPGEPDLELALDGADTETLEAFNRLRNGFMRGEEARAALERTEADRAEREEFVELVAMDPIGFMTKQLGAQHRAQAAMTLLTAPDVWEAVAEDVRQIVEDPQRLELARQVLANKHYQVREELRTAAEERKAARAQAKELEGHVRALVPGLSPEQADAFVRSAMSDLAAAVRAGVRSFHPAHMPALLAERLQEFGVDPVSAALRVARTGTTSPTGTATAAPPAAPKAPARPTLRKPTAKDVQQALAQRQAAAVVPPPGSVAPSAATPPVENGRGLKATFAALRDKVRGGQPLT